MVNPVVRFMILCSITLSPLAYTGSPPRVHVGIFKEIHSKACAFWYTGSTDRGHR